MWYPNGDTEFFRQTEKLHMMCLIENDSEAALTNLDFQIGADALADARGIHIDSLFYIHVYVYIYICYMYTASRICISVQSLRLTPPRTNAGLLSMWSNMLARKLSSHFREEAQIAICSAWLSALNGFVSVIDFQIGADALADAQVIHLDSLFS